MHKESSGAQERIMSVLTPLASPYIQEISLELLPREVQDAMLCTGEKRWHVLLDILHRDVYLVATDVISDLVNSDKIDAVMKTAYRHSQYCGIEVEINSHCNLRCSFCPVSFAPYPRRVMSLDQFRHVVGEAVSCKIEEISLVFYSEPTLHPSLGEIVKYAVEASLSVTLFTNGTALHPSLVDRLLPFREGISVIANIADPDPDEYRRITKRPLLSKVLQNVRYAAQKLRLEVVLNNSNEEKIVKMQAILPGITVTQWRTDDRAGLLKTEGIPSQYHTGLLNGCPLAIRWVNVSVDGDVFLCPQDYWKLNVMGNIFTESLESIFRSESAWQFRRWCFGLEEAPNNWICRRCSWTAERKENFSVGAPLSDVDKRVYGDIFRQSVPTAIWSVNGKPYSMRCESWEAFKNTCLP